MNICLFSNEEWNKPLALSDRRSIHIIKTLKLKKGDSLDVGLVGQGVGTATLAQIDHEIIIDFPQILHSPNPPIKHEIVLGHVRPLVMQRLFKDFASLGLAKIHIINCSLSEKSYFESSFWKDEDYKKSLIEGLEQGCLVEIPEVIRHWSVKQFVGGLEWQGQKWVFHLGEFAKFEPRRVSEPLMFAIGPERGFTEVEVAQFQNAGFKTLSLGPRVMRSELVASAISVLVSL